jgi:hypothetical protein
LLKNNRSKDCVKNVDTGQNLINRKTYINCYVSCQKSKIKNQTQ